MRVKGLLLLVVLVVAMTGCSLIGRGRYNNELRELLPNRVGLVWRYSGFAEYDHHMTLDAIEQMVGGTRYVISGEVGDPSGGAAVRDRNLKITYTIRNGMWLQEKQEEAMMDSEFDRLEILRGPLRQGATWTQRQTDKGGTAKTLVCTIEEIRVEDGVRVIGVKYQDKDSEYFERRHIKQGVGIILFEKLWMSREGNFEIGYSLFATE